jgi:large subunit ribosomal protein L17
LYKNLSLSLFEHGSIKTTHAKAKAVSRFVDKLITLAKKNSVASRRELAKVFGKRKPTNYLVDKVAPQLTRTSGYTRIVKLGKRQGDDAVMARLELIDFKKPQPKTETKKPKTKKAAPKKSKQTKKPKSKNATKK